MTAKWESEFAERLVERFPELLGSREAHLAYFEEFIPYVFLGELAEDFSSSAKNGSREMTSGPSLLDFAQFMEELLLDGDIHFHNLVALDSWKTWWKLDSRVSPLRSLAC